MIKGGGSEFPEKWRVGIDLVPALSQCARNLLYIQIVFDSVPLCVWVRGIFPKLSIIPNFLPITPHLAHFSIESLDFDTKTILPSPKNSSVPLAEIDCSFSICSHYSFSLFIASGLQNEKRQHLNFFVRSYFENICGPQLSLGLLLAHVGQNNCDKTDWRPFSRATT